MGKHLSPSGVNMSRIESTIMHIDYDKEPNNDYNMVVVGINFNVAELLGGCFKIMYYT